MSPVEKAMAKVLLVDNDPVTLKTLSHPLETAGHCVLLASNGRRAWETLEDNPGIEVVITDLSMPEMSGQELVAKIRSEERTAKIPVLMMSAHCSISAVSKLLESGSSLFLPKPVTTRDLFAHLDSVTRSGVRAS